MRNRNSWIIFAALTFLVALIWVAVTAVGSLRKTTVSADVAKAAAPMDPTIDVIFLKTLNARS
ncbi:MAG: hypothetical protein M1484_05000 [Patescibacteria group bacterium]|nr:hypothetical protein [Patescibacteria group bacterium]